MVGLISYVKITGRIYGYSTWTPKTGASGKAAVPTISRCTITCHGTDRPITGAHPADAVVTPINYVKISGRIHGYSTWASKTGTGGKAAVPTISKYTITCYGTDRPITGAHPADAVVISFNYVKIAGRIHGYSIRAK